MALEALLDGNRVTGIRTAASSALAVDLLAPQRPLTLAARVVQKLLLELA